MEMNRTSSTLSHPYIDKKGVNNFSEMWRLIRKALEATWTVLMIHGCILAWWSAQELVCSLVLCLMSFVHWAWYNRTSSRSGKVMIRRPCLLNIAKLKMGKLLLCMVLRDGGRTHWNVWV